MGMYEHFKSQRWICFIAALIVCVCAGFGYSWSVLQGPIAQKFGWNEGAVSLTFTITVICSTMSPLFFGSVIQKITDKKVRSDRGYPFWSRAGLIGNHDLTLAAVRLLRSPFRSGLRICISQSYGICCKIVSG